MSEEDTLPLPNSINALPPPQLLQEPFRDVTCFFQSVFNSDRVSDLVPYRTSLRRLVRTQILQELGRLFPLVTNQAFNKENIKPA